MQIFHVPIITGQNLPKNAFWPATFSSHFQRFSKIKNRRKKLSLKQLRIILSKKYSVTLSSAPRLGQRVRLS